MKTKKEIKDSIKNNGDLMEACKKLGMNEGEIILKMFRQSHPDEFKNCVVDIIYNEQYK